MTRKTFDRATTLKSEIDHCDHVLDAIQNSTVDELHDVHLTFSYGPMLSDMQVRLTREMGLRILVLAKDLHTARQTELRDEFSKL